MTDQASVPMGRAVLSGGQLYRAVWKWHFIASLLVLPFMMLMLATGGLYLFKGSIEESIYADRLNVVPAGNVNSFEEMAAAASQVAPGRIAKFFTPETPDRSMVFEVTNKSRHTTVVWVNPYTAKVLAAQPQETMFFEVIEGLHTRFLLGNTGKYLVEVLASWAIVMFVTGLYLWWPRGARKWADVFKIPTGSGRQFWRATHLWTGFIATIIIVPIIFAGMFWTNVWGATYLKTQLAMKHFSPVLAYGGPPVFAKSQEGPILPMDILIEKGREAGLSGMLEIRPPVAPKFGMLMRTDEKYAMEDQLEIFVDTRSGEVLRKGEYSAARPMAYWRSWAARYHLEMLGGWNWYLNFFGVLFLLALTVSGFVAWWKRRPAGSIGVPAAPLDSRLGVGLLVLVIFLGIFLPTVGISLIGALLLDWLVLKRLGWLQPENAKRG